MSNDSLMIGLGARFYKHEGKLFVERQTISGLKAWQVHFPHIVAFSIEESNTPPPGWIKAEDAGVTLPDFHLVSLPDTYKSFGFGPSRKRCERILFDLMKQTRFRVFSYGGWLGDPGEIAASIARKHKLSHAVWLDRVESQLVLSMQSDSVIDNLKSTMKSKIIALNEKRAVRAADLSLLHGATVFNHFERFATNPQVADNVHLRAADRIAPDRLSTKLADLERGPLKILYCGRAHPMKGGSAWVQTLVDLKKSGVEFRAVWIGDGTELDEMKEMARAAKLTDAELIFPGFVENSESVLEYYRSAHVFMFCHMTDESPRNLIESLHAGTPIVGFRDPYAASLIAEKGAGELVDRGDIQKLCYTIKNIEKDRTKLADLVRKAAASASHLTRDRVFQQRSKVVKEFLSN